MNFRRLLRLRPRPPGQLHIAFVACNRNPDRFREDPSFIYRCENMGMALQAAGYRITYSHLSRVFEHGVPDVAVFHRPRYSFRLASVLYWLRRNGTTLVADVDDLIFDMSLSRFSPGVLNELVSLPKTRQQFADHCRALASFDLLTTSTQPLAKHLLRCLPRAKTWVLPNAVHLAWRQAGKDAPRKIRTRPVVTYFPGTRSHNRDFAVYADGVGRFLAANPEARLEVTGPLSFELPARPGQVVHRPKVPFEKYVERVRNGWVNLAPLEVTPFNRCKSALKVLEAGFSGVPTICSPLPDANRFAAAGAVFAEDSDACFAALQSMTEPAHYQAAIDDLSARVLAEADVMRVADAFLQFIGVQSPFRPQ